MRSPSCIGRPMSVDYRVIRNDSDTDISPDTDGSPYPPDLQQGTAVAGVPLCWIAGGEPGR